MTQEEKIDAVFSYVRLNYLLASAIINKSDAVRKQDFTSAIKFRDEENELRKQRLETFEKIFNSEQNPERSVATEVDSSNQADKQI